MITDMDDHELLRKYDRERSEEAFRELVDRHLGMVYAAARRMVGDWHLAEEVAQDVFCTLARKAGTVRPPHVVAGWLYQTTRHLAMHGVRSDQRRREREQTAVANSVEAVCGLVATKSRRDDLQPWIERWVSLDPTNALPHYLAAWHSFARSNYLEGFRSLVQGNEQGQAWFRPLYSKLLKERILDSPKPGKEFSGWNPEAWGKTATKLMDVWNWVYRNPDLSTGGIAEGE